MDCFSCPLANGGIQEDAVKPGYNWWRKVTKLNLNHQEWAWSSMISVGLTDLYIRLCSAGVIHDLRFF